MRRWSPVDDLFNNAEFVRIPKSQSQIGRPTSCPCALTFATVSLMARRTGGCGITMPSHLITPKQSPDSCARLWTSSCSSTRHGRGITLGSLSHGLDARMTLTRNRRSEGLWARGPTTEGTTFCPSICLQRRSDLRQGKGYGLSITGVRNSHVHYWQYPSKEVFQMKASARTGCLHQPANGQRHLYCSPSQYILSVVYNYKLMVLTHISP